MGLEISIVGIITDKVDLTSEQIEKMIESESEDVIFNGYMSRSHGAKDFLKIIRTHCTRDYVLSNYPDIMFGGPKLYKATKFENDVPTEFSELDYGLMHVSDSSLSNLIQEVEFLEMTCNDMKNGGMKDLDMFLYEIKNKKVKLSNSGRLKGSGKTFEVYMEISE